jgi:peptidoglycan/xylan/chitin deacetylase (PgdA/CDA1 family)
MTRVTLTFDNGPDPTWTPHVLDVLRAHDLRASFFAIGHKLVLDPSRRALLERAREEGHWIGNHSYNHVYSLGDIDRADAFDVEVTSTFDVLGDLAHPDRLFRPFCNAGRLDDRVFKRVDVDRMLSSGCTCVLFNSIPRDWNDGTGWVQRALDDIETRPWSTVVLHDIPGYPDGVDERPMRRLDDFIVAARDAGHEFVQAYSPDCVLAERGEARKGLAALTH